jgi:predicted transcriptional regulator
MIVLHSSEASITLELKDFIKSLAETKVPGQPLSFSVFHLFCALELLSEKTVGRSRLAEHLNVGEGTARTILHRLVAAGLMTASKAGCKLSDEGFQVWQELERVFPKRIEFSRSELSPCAFSFAFLNRRCSEKVESGIEQRDAAIIAGATYAVILVFRNGRLYIESVGGDIMETFPEAAQLILRELQPQNGDVIVIAGADTALKAKHGAFAASWSLFAL